MDDLSSRRELRASWARQTLPEVALLPSFVVEYERIPSKFGRWRFRRYAVTDVRKSALQQGRFAALGLGHTNARRQPERRVLTAGSGCDR
jgi:hypothetical protein